MYPQIHITLQCKTHIHTPKPIKSQKMLPCTRGPSGHFRLKLHRQTQEAIEPIEGDMGHVAHIGGPTDLHGTKLPPFPLARSQRLPEIRDQQCQQRELFPPPSVTVSHRSTAAATVIFNYWVVCWGRAG